jgi:choline kinase
VILIAGKGRRLGEGLPKCLNTIGSKTILERQLNALRRLGIDKVICVVGYEKARIKQAVKEFWGGQVTFVENRRYETTNTIYSLYLAIRYVKDDFVYMNGDVVFRADLVDCLVEQDGDGVLGIVAKRCGQEEVKVMVEDNTIVGIGKKLPPEKCLGEFIGVALFRKSILDSFSKSLQNLVEVRGLINEYFEAGLAEIVDKVLLKVVDITHVPCIEIDYPEDLKWAQEHSSDFGED